MPPVSLCSDRRCLTLTPCSSLLSCRRGRRRFRCYESEPDERHDVVGGRIPGRTKGPRLLSLKRKLLIRPLPKLFEGRTGIQKRRGEFWRYRCLFSGGRFSLTFDPPLTYRGLVGCCLARFGVLLLLSSFREETRFVIVGIGEEEGNGGRELGACSRTNGHVQLR